MHFARFAGWRATCKLVFQISTRNFLQSQHQTKVKSDPNLSTLTYKWTKMGLARATICLRAPLYFSLNSKRSILYDWICCCCYRIWIKVSSAARLDSGLQAAIGIPIICKVPKLCSFWLNNLYIYYKSIVVINGVSYS